MILGITLDKSNSGTLCTNLIEIIRQKILNGELKNGEKLPSTRMLAKNLQIARNTVINAYEQLIAEGYLESQNGSGTYVKLLSDFKLPKKQTKNDIHERVIHGFPKDTIIFDTGTPDNTMFPAVAWAKALKKACQSASVRAFGYSNVSGNSNLKDALCRYLYRSKGIKCHQKNIFITSGTSGGISLISDIFKLDYRKIAVEDPCIDFVKYIFLSRGYTTYSVPVDEQGMITSELKNHCLETPSLIYTVPSHQFPTGAILSASRRLELLKYAVNTGAYMIEDDYDSEFNYDTKPVQPLYNLDSEHTIYIGTFSKIFSPAIRLGYMILPDNLIPEVEKIAEQQNIRTEILTQLAMAEYINQKMLDRHIYKMKKIYAAKRKHMISCINKYFNDKAIISGENAGLHLLVSFTKNFSLEDILQNGVSVECAEYYSTNKSIYKNKLILGYGNLDFNQIEHGIERLAKAL